MRAEQEPGTGREAADRRLDDHELAAALARAGGELAAAMRRDGVAVETKTSITDVVTAADRAAEELILARLAAARPDDAIVGEEGTDRAGPSGRTWYLDPVDGTYNFTRGLPTWCAAVGLADADGPVLGAIYQPATGELWVGGRDRPTTCNGEPVAVDERGLADVAVVSYLHPGTLGDDTVRLPLLRAVGAAATVRMLGSGSVELAAIAGGRLGCFVQHDCLPWDWVPGAALVAAAGGTLRLVELDGRVWHIAGGPRAADDAAAALRRVG